MKTFFRTIYWYAYFFISVFSTYPTIRRLEKELASNKDNENFDAIEFDEKVFKLTAKWAEKVIKASGSNVIVEGQENIPKESGILFVSNHQGNFDIPVHMAYVNTPKGFVAKKSIEKFPIVNRYMKLMNCLFIDRDNMRDSAKVIIEGVKLIKQGHNLVIFPEGTRAKGYEMGEFKDGAFRLATKANAPIVPVSINDTYRIMEANDDKIKGRTVRLFIHEPIETKDLTKEEIQELPHKVKKIIEDKVLELNGIHNRS